MLVDRARAGAAEAADEVASLAARQGLRLEEQEPLTKGELQVPEGCEMLVVLGGDGTLLCQARRAVELKLPILGVNLGRLGFMAAFDLARVRELAGELFGSRNDATGLADRELMLLQAEIFAADSDVARYQGIALNEAALTAGSPFRMIELELTVDGRPGPTIAGDGLLVCTPTGSTAYNVSAGGPIIAPGVDALTVTAIAAHTLAFRPFVLQSDSVFEARVHRGNDDPQGDGTTLVIDGQVLLPVNTGERLVVRRSPQTVRFLTDPAVRFWDTVIEKLHWAARPKMRKGASDWDAEDGSEP